MVVALLLQAVAPLLADCTSSAVSIPVGQGKPAIAPPLGRLGILNALFCFSKHAAWITRPDGGRHTDQQELSWRCY
jgi:hypothetical protein